MPNTISVVVSGPFQRVVETLRSFERVEITDLQANEVTFVRPIGDAPVLGYGGYEDVEDGIVLSVEDRADTGAALDLYQNFTAALPYAVRVIDDAAGTVVVSREALKTIDSGQGRTRGD